MRLILSLVTLLLLVLTGCSQPEPTNSNTPPSWIMNPNQNGKVGSVGTAYRHHKGLSFQRRLAITRALDEMALQQGVKVTLSMTKKENITNQNVSSKMDVDSTYKANSTLKAHIEEVWQDKNTQEYFIWLVLD